jgi:hypothetical protein
MTPWIERLRQKKSPYGRNQGDKSIKRVDGDAVKNFVDGRNHSDKRAKSPTFVTSGTLVSTVSEVFVVEYQRFWLDYDLPDGSYTPTELQKAGFIVHPGPILRYRLHWPGGTPQPITRRAPMSPDQPQEA